ncbi:MAG: hypothetical protein ACRCTU_01665, partial [Zoogloea sp.]|uniref:hypothetical protein n=1 Tax=Zoogloea sp. TaxID=49181 RepID=UPI003F402EBA
TPGQFAKKNLASSQEVIWEQRVRPSQRKPPDWAVVDFLLLPMEGRRSTFPEALPSGQGVL